jgi:hypothetical protein
MEADWSVEVGADLPTIDVPWEGFVDLRHDPSLVSSLDEAASSAILAQVLVMLNQRDSPVFTSKCDLWRLAEDEIDPLEFDAAREKAMVGIACYVDIIARRESLLMSFSAHETWARLATKKMRSIKMRRSRADLVVRPATTDESDGYGLTLYVASCGATENDALNGFPMALETAAAITMNLAATKGE